jgi:ribosomal protein S18 acetylase RimI-like enzyme
MKNNKPSGLTIKIREAEPDDLPFLRSLALEAFSIYGDYETILTDFFVSPGVYTYVTEETGQNVAIPVAILMMAIRKRKRRDPHIAEILAIAVEKPFQGRGIGTHLIAFAKRWPLSLSGSIWVPEIHLSVADSNKRGQAFFRRHGFETFQTEPWNYPGGQKAFRMRCFIQETRAALP